MLDGTTSENDWDGLVPFEQLPWVINPKRGYISTANNRVVPDNVFNDAGATTMSTNRAFRIDEILSKGVAAGKKFDV